MAPHDKYHRLDVRHGTKTPLHKLFQILPLRQSSERRPAGRPPHTAGIKQQNVISAFMQEDVRKKPEDSVSRRGRGCRNQLFRLRTVVISEVSHWSSIRPPSQLHGCRITASPTLPEPVDVSGEYNFASRETPEGSLTISRSDAIEVLWKAAKRLALYASPSDEIAGSCSVP